MTQLVNYPQHFIRLPWKLSGTQLYSSYFWFNATWLCIFSIKIASFPLTKVWEKVIINCIRGYIARAHVKFWFHIVDDSRSKRCLKDLNEELLCCICRELNWHTLCLAHTLSVLVVSGTGFGETYHRAFFQFLSHLNL